MGFAQSSVFGSQVTLGAGFTDMRMLQRKENVPTVSEHPLKAEPPHRTFPLLFYAWRAISYSRLFDLY